MNTICVKMTVIRSGKAHDFFNVTKHRFILKNTDVNITISKYKTK